VAVRNSRNPCNQPAFAPVASNSIGGARVSHGDSSPSIRALSE